MLPEKFDGFSNPWVIGMSSGSWFPLHIEEQDQPSINYLHVPDRSVPELADLPIAKKIWTVVPSNQSQHVEKLMDLLLDGKQHGCPNFIAHKYILLNPHILTTFGIDTYYGSQEEGEYTVIYPRAYHTGMLKMALK